LKQKTYFKAPPLKDNLKAPEMMQLTKEQEAYISTFAKIQQSTMEIDMLTGQYVMASLHQDKSKKQRCADLMVERAKVLLEAAEKLAKF
jgi:hypothetical protein